MSNTTVIYLSGTNSRDAVGSRLGLSRDPFWWLETTAATYLKEFGDLKIPYSPLVPYQIWVLEQLARFRRSDRKLSRKHVTAALKNNPQNYSVQVYLRSLKQCEKTN